MKIALVLAAGILVGVILSVLVFKVAKVGTLIFYRDSYEPNTELLMSAELDKDIYSIYSRRYVIFRINDKIVSVNNTQK